MSPITYLTSTLGCLIRSQMYHVQNQPSDFPPKSPSPHLSKCQFHFCPSLRKQTDKNLESSLTPYIFSCSTSNPPENPVGSVCDIYPESGSVPPFPALLPQPDHHLPDLDFHKRLLTGLPAFSLASLFNTMAARVILLKPKSDYITILLKTFSGSPPPSLQGPA